MIRVTAFVHLDASAPASAASSLIETVRGAASELDALTIDAAPTAPFTRLGGDVMILAAFADAESYAAARRHPYVELTLRPQLAQHAQHVEAVRYRQGPTNVRAPELERGVHRTLLLRVDPSADPRDARALERALIDMPAYITEIRNSSLSRVDEVRGSLGPMWTHVWEQEFDTIDALSGPYMRHAYHWSYVDTWFDPQAPNHIVDTRLLHSACDLRRSVLAATVDDTRNT